MPDPDQQIGLDRLKHEAIDRLDSVIEDLPRYKENLAQLVHNFTVEEMLVLINTIHRDREFQLSTYVSVYTVYFDEIEDLAHRTLW